MIETGPAHVLFIEPRSPATREPIIDRYTRRMAGALRVAEPPPPLPMRYCGVHTCVCGMHSATYNLVVPARTWWWKSITMTTNSLAVHYLAHHRAEVPAAELAKVMRLRATPTDPLATDLSNV